MCSVPTPIRYVQCPHLNNVCAVSPPSSICFLSKLCGVPTPFVPLIKKVCAVSSLPVQFFQCNSVPLPHLALSWILSKVENLESSSLQDEATDYSYRAQV